MGRSEAVAVLNVPLESVWNCLNDIDRTPEWVVGLERAELKTPLPYGLGAIYHDINRLGPFLQVTPWRVTVFEPMSHQVHESTSRVLPSRMALHLSPTPEGTEIQMVVEYRLLPRLGWLSKLLEAGVMNRLLAGVMRQNLAHLGRYLERGETA